MNNNDCSKCGSYTPFLTDRGKEPLCVRCRLIWDTMEFQSLDAVNSFLKMGAYPALIGKISPNDNGRYLVQYAIPNYNYPK